MAYSGKFVPKNPEKYRGNVQGIVWRSTWERVFARWCDNSAAVLAWGSEELYIPYLSPIDKQTHRYFPDFFVKIQQRDGNIKKFLVEIKPHAQTLKPVLKYTKKGKLKKSMKQEMETFFVNLAKWDAAEHFCGAHNMEFLILTEHQLGL